MKKLLILGLMLIALPAVATTICADDDVIAIVLDPEIAGTSRTSDENLFEWGVTFPYGSVWGIATCMDTPGTNDTAVPELRSADGELATGGERKGEYCWCKMIHPAVSQWVFRTMRSPSSICSSSCAIDCAYFGVYDVRLRRGLFGSVAH